MLIQQSYLGYMKPFEIKGSGSAIFRMGANYSYPSINDSIIDATPKLIIWGNKDQWVPIMSAFDYLKTKYRIFNHWSYEDIALWKHTPTK